MVNPVVYNECRKIIGQRIRLLRKQLGWSQTDFMEILLEHEPNILSAVSTIAGWEQGRKCPNIDALLLITKIFSCSLDYLVGKSDIVNPAEYSASTCYKSKNEISYKDLHEFDNLPIYVEFEELQENNGYGILDFKNKTIHFIDRKITIDSLKRYKYHVAEPHYCSVISSKNSTPIDNLEEIMIHNNVYIEIKSTSDMMRAEYNGWYKHNENKTGFIKENGLILPYSGLNQFYFVYNFI